MEGHAMKLTNWIVSLIAAGVMISAGAAQAQLKDLNQIIRGLAPMKYLPEHSGKPQRPHPERPSIDLDIRFDLDRASLAPQARAQLRELGRALQSAQLRGKLIEITGHTDTSGPAAHNKALSLRRAGAVASYLRREFAIDTRRLSVAGHGEERLKDPTQPRGAVNRRVEISVTGTVAMAAEPRTMAASNAGNAGENGESGTWGNLLGDAARARNFLRRTEANGTGRIIVMLAAPKQDAIQAGSGRDPGWRNLNDYIHDLQDQAIARLGWTNINDLVRFDYTPAMAMTVDPPRLRQLLTGDAAVQVYEDRLLPPRLQQSVPLIGLVPPRGPSHSGTGMAVAVIDSGVDSQHPFLRGKVVGEACFSAQFQSPEVSARSACPSGERQEVGPGAGQPCGAPYDCSHGTHVAGIVAGHNAEMSGVALQATIVAVQVSSLIEMSKCGKCALPLTSNILRGLEWVYRNRERYKIAAVNLSLGGGKFQAVCDGNSPYTRIFALLAESGVAPVVSSGNDGFADAISDPACVSHAISVGATSYRDNVSGFSNSAEFLDFLAPGATEQAYENGKGILSAVPGSEFRRYQGTSMAAPHVAGAFAILKSAVPAASLAQMREALHKTGHMIADPRNGVTAPRIQLDTAITFLQASVSRTQPKQPQKPAPRAKPKERVHDGIRVEDGKEIGGENGGGKDGEKRIKW
jgi:outer membrane protein OmpA-like peptidoglycan-associated protein